MNRIGLKKLNGLINLQKEIQPKTYLDELAESGLLEIYLEDFLKDKYSMDVEFKDRIIESLYNYSGEINDKVEEYYLENLCQSFGFFLEYTKECRKLNL